METSSALLALCAGNWNSPVIPLPKAIDTEFYDFFDLRLYKRLSKLSRRRWFQTPSCSLWRHCIASSLSKRWKCLKTKILPYNKSCLRMSLQQRSLFSTLRTRQDGHQFTDDIFKCIFFRWECSNFDWESIEVCSQTVTVQHWSR